MTYAGHSIPILTQHFYRGYRIDRVRSKTMPLQQEYGSGVFYVDDCSYWLIIKDGKRIDGALKLNRARQLIRSLLSSTAQTMGNTNAR